MFTCARNSPVWINILTECYIHILHVAGKWKEVCILKQCLLEFYLIFVLCPKYAYKWFMFDLNNWLRKPRNEFNMVQFIIRCVYLTCPPCWKAFVTLPVIILTQTFAAFHLIIFLWLVSSFHCLRSLFSHQNKLSMLCINVRQTETVCVCITHLLQCLFVM